MSRGGCRPATVFLWTSWSYLCSISPVKAFEGALVVVPLRRNARRRSGYHYG